MPVMVSLKICRLLTLVNLLALSAFSSQVWARDAQKLPAYMDTSLSFEQRAEDLVSRMSLEEKAGQLINDAPAIPRLGVREYNWWSEGLHGVAATGTATVFPQAIGMAATWNAPLLEKVAGVIGVEFRAKLDKNKHRLGGSDWFGGLTVWSPNINIFRDPRWGRGQETYGEDPYLTSRLGVSFVRGLQGGDNRYLLTVATPKHFAVHSGPEPGRHRDNVKPSAHDLEDTYLPAFQATVEEGGAYSVMCAYNAVDGVPACANETLLNGYLRDKWGFGGYVVSDCGAVEDVYREGHHGFVETPEEAIAKTFSAGMDLICGDGKEANNIISAVRNNMVGEDVIDRALVRLFTARMRLGQFDPEEDVFPNITGRDFDTPEHRDLALQVARESLVLLKNENDFLPIKSTPANILVVGKNADSIDALVGNYNGDPSHPVTILDGIRARFANSRVTYAQGSELIYPVLAPVPDSVLCRTAECGQGGLLAEYFLSHDTSGKPASSADVANARLAWTGQKRRGSARWSGYLKAPESGEYNFRFDANGGYRIWVNDTMVVDAWRVDWRPSIVTGRITLEKGKVYPIRVESFQRKDQGDERLLWSLPSDPGAREAVAAAQSADLVIFVAGLASYLEGEEMLNQPEGFIGGDRSTLDLPEVQQKLLEKIADSGKPLVLVLTNGSALALNWADKHVPGIIEAWYPGGQGGQAVAELIAGDFSPAGRLPVTFYESVDQLPAFSDYAMNGRTYRYFTGEPLYPFGYGLSYSSFRYENLEVTKRSAENSEIFTVSATVTNTGSMDGDEVVQLYLSHPHVEGAPIRALSGFRRIALKKGQSEKVSFELPASALSIVDDAGVRRVVPGTVQVWVGGGQPIEGERLVKATGVAATLEITKSGVFP